MEIYLYVVSKIFLQERFRDMKHDFKNIEIAKNQQNSYYFNNRCLTLALFICNECQ